MDAQMTLVVIISCPARHNHRQGGGALRKTTLSRSVRHTGYFTNRVLIEVGERNERDRGERPIRGHQMIG